MAVRASPEGRLGQGGEAARQSSQPGSHWSTPEGKASSHGRGVLQEVVSDYSCTVHVLI